MKVGDFAVQRLPPGGDRRIYGYPGDGISGVIGASTTANFGSHDYQRGP